MKTLQARRRNLLLMAMVVAVPALVQAASPRPLNRSIYVPINIRVCEHLQNAVLYQGGQAVAVPTTRRVFQFTYYSELKRMEPQVVQLRIEGVYADTGEPFVARLAVTPWGIHTALREVTFDSSKAMQRLRYKIDTRSPMVDLRIRCDKMCSRANRTKAVVSEDSSMAAVQAPEQSLGDTPRTPRGPGS